MCNIFVTLDSEGKEIGRVIDFVFHYEDDKMELESMILGGSRFQEFLETIGIKPDSDPVIDVDSIEEVNEEMHLSVTREELQTTLDADVLQEDDMTFSDLSKIPVVDSGGKKIGNVIDVWFDSKGMIWLVLGGGFLEETLEDLGLQPDIDFIASEGHIISISKERIRLKMNKFELESTAEEKTGKKSKYLKLIGEPAEER
jgi:sporulation protein YlmC with PRC-barrel domain